MKNIDIIRDGKIVSSFLEESIRNLKENYKNLVLEKTLGEIMGYALPKDILNLILPKEFSVLDGKECPKESIPHEESRGELLNNRDENLCRKE